MSLDFNELFRLASGAYLAPEAVRKSLISGKTFPDGSANPHARKGLARIKGGSQTIGLIAAANQNNSGAQSALGRIGHRLADAFFPLVGPVNFDGVGPGKTVGAPLRAQRNFKPHAGTKPLLIIRFLQSCCHCGRSKGADSKNSARQDQDNV